MLVAKQIADLITFSRALTSLILVWVGVEKGSLGLPIAVILMLYSWTSDILDGPLARRSRLRYHTWLGDHDLEVDMCVSLGLLVYLLISEHISTLLAASYLILWILVFLYWGFYRSLGMLFQAPIYGWFLWISLRDAPGYGISLLVWIALALILTWPRFHKEVVPGFLQGLRIIRKQRN